MEENKRKAIDAIKSVDGVTIPVVNIVATYVEPSELIGEFLFRVLVLPNNDKAYRYFEVNRTQYPRFINPLPEEPEDYLIATIEYDYTLEFEKRIKELDPDNNADGLKTLGYEVSEWALPKARKDLREFNKKIAEKLPDVTNIIKF